MKHLTRFIPLLAVLFCTTAATAQQDPTFTRYLFNPLVYNPAIAGHKEYLILTALHRDQFIGLLEGGPTTQIVSGDLPVGKGKRVGLGMTLSNDRIGPTQQINADFSYAYRFKIGEGKFALGLSAGLLNWRSDWSKLTAYDDIDPAFSTGGNISIFRPKFGAGLYYQHPSFYIGLGVPHLVDFDFSSQGIGNDYFAKQYRHYLLTAGTQFYFSNDLQFRPNIVLRSVGLFGNTANSVKSPTSVDIDASLLFMEKFQIGAAYRFALENPSNSTSANSDSFSAWFSYYINQNVKIGGSYDFPLNKIGQASGGAYQIMVSYEFYNVVSKVSPVLVH